MDYPIGGNDRQAIFEGIISVTIEKIEKQTFFIFASGALSIKMGKNWTADGLQKGEGRDRQGE